MLVDSLNVCRFLLRSSSGTFMTILRRATVAQALFVVWICVNDVVYSDGKRTNLISKPDVPRALLRSFMFLRIIVSILEQEYQSINWLSELVVSEKRIEDGAYLRQKGKRIIIKSEGFQDLDVLNSILS